MQPTMPSRVPKTNTPLPCPNDQTPGTNAVHTLPPAPLVLSAPNKEKPPATTVGVDYPDLRRRAVPR